MSVDAYKHNRNGCAVILAPHLPCISYEGMLSNLWRMATQRGFMLSSLRHLNLHPLQVEPQKLSLAQRQICCADLHTLHGLQPVVQLLAHDSPRLQAAAAFVLGTAASNNNKFQEQLMHLHPETITLLLQVCSHIGQ